MSQQAEPVVPSGDGGLVRVRFGVAYDGGAFSGWAAQPGRRTVQRELEEALARVLRVPVALTVAGRTDAGVHAVGQVAHADVPIDAWSALGRRRARAGGGDGAGVPAGDGAPRSAEGAAAGRDLVRRLAGVLPADVRVRAAGLAAAGFDARFSAVWRRYAYRVLDDPAAADPLRRHDTLTWPRRLDLAALREASAGLLGEHDFAAFCKRRDGATTVRGLQQLDWDRDAAGVLTATVRADAFCHSMVRSLVGALIAVGEGRRPAAWPASLLAGRDRSGAVTVAPAHGLTLLEVGYPADAELAARAETTRRRREIDPAGRETSAV